MPHSVVANALYPVWTLSKFYTLNPFFPSFSASPLTCASFCLHPAREQVPFDFAALHDSTLHAIAAYFDVDFTYAHTDVYFSTGPQYPPTRWKQTVFPLDDPINMHQHTVIEGSFGCKLAANTVGSAAPTHATFTLSKSSQLVQIPPKSDGKKRRTDKGVQSSNRGNDDNPRNVLKLPLNQPAVAAATPPTAKQ